MNRAAGLASAGLDVKYVKVLELLPGGRELLVRARVGWKPARLYDGEDRSIAIEQVFPLLQNVCNSSPGGGSVPAGGPDASAAPGPLSTGKSCESPIGAAFFMVPSSRLSNRRTRMRHRSNN